MAPLLWMSLVPADNLSTNLSPDQLSSIKAQLDLVLMAIEALADIGYDGYCCAEAFPVPDSEEAARQTIETFKTVFRS